MFSRAVVSICNTIMSQSHNYVNLTSDETLGVVKKDISKTIASSTKIALIQLCHLWLCYVLFEISNSNLRSGYPLWMK